MALWPVTDALGAGGAQSLLLAGLGAGSGATSPPPPPPPPPPSGSPVMTPLRTLMPIHLSGYAGRDFPPLSIDADEILGIDLGPALDPGDTLVAASLALLFYPVEAGQTNYASAIDGTAALIGTVAVQAIGRPPPGRYLLGFTCQTAAGRTIEIHSFFNATSLPNASV
ncbi:MAG TPA: hypothetical protein VKZ79_03510 [Alphaproteobacteria bacterium]|nr:hypothetical protein [Alphaproteobacteria bacterium]